MTIQCDIVSAEKQIFSGQVETIVATGTEGDMGVSYGHAPLLSSLKPGPIRICTEQSTEEVYYVSGGYIEIQPYIVTVLADTVLRAEDMDEAAALEAKDNAEQKIANCDAEFDYYAAVVQLAEASAQLRTLQSIRKKFSK